MVDVLKVNNSSSEGAATLLPAGVLSTKLLCKVLVITDCIFTEKNILDFVKSSVNMFIENQKHTLTFFSKENTVYCFTF